ncbi:FtsX-like permease family protein [Pedobacter polaris]|uniref:FtsX-like permease family protein n=1 Tax=Pedobacter polaris TaxID=2571273 RepID=A0A4U1CIH1_9SPHI|nr:ABC transporter permease [Pedobacter polaris]TKC06500.1 FtsX-like permease family protein [Pedobacter polaris]
MFKLNLKIALRNLWRNIGITSINVGGLAVALAAFMLLMMYFTYETSFDKKNPNFDNIYIVGRTFPDFKTNYTPPPFGKAIKENFSEVVAVGKMKKGGFELAVSSHTSTVFTKQQLFVEYEAAKMFNIIPEGGLKKPNGNEFLYYLSKPYMQTLFPNKKDTKPEMVSIGSRSAEQFGEVRGSIVPDSHSNISFDAVSIVNEIGTGESYGHPNYFTYIQVKPGTDIASLELKINNLYHSELTKNGMVDEGEDVTETNAFLDPLKNQHLKPKAGSDANYKVLIALSVLGFLILVIACINFTNLSIAQAAKRAKEVGVKKVMGAYRFQLTIQFLIEILMQCLVATVLGLIIAEIVLPKFNSLFLVHLSIWNKENGLIWQLPVILLFITLIAGIYPAMVLSGFKPAAVLKGNFQTSRQSYWLRNSLLVVQFSIAVIFITGLLIINSQLKYMRTQDVGFNPEQVVYVKNLVYYTKPEVFAPVREKIMKIPGVKAVTVANAIPDGSGMGGNGYTVEGKQHSLSFLDVDYDYFETLNIKLKEGRAFSTSFQADAVNSAILNEAAVAKYGIQNPIGKTIRGCNIDYTIVGVINDLKAEGFEKAVEPTIYAINNPCGNPKTEIMVKVDEQRMAEVLAILKSQWSDINKRDGDNFRYHFLDELYGKLFAKQEQLQSVFFAAALLTIFIAILGLFAFAKYITNGRIKEIAVRKILGANDLQIFKLINTSFFVMVMIANLISWPLAYILTKKWLETFAYRIEIPILPFVLSALITIMLTIITVTIQANRAVRANPVDALKYE